MYDVLPQTDTLHLRYTISLGKLVVNTIVIDQTKAGKSQKDWIYKSYVLAGYRKSTK